VTLVRPESLPVAEPVRALAERIAAAGGRLLLVGGFVRDGCLGREPSDVDIELYDLSRADALRVLREAGLETIESVGRHFPVWLARGAGLDPFEFSLVEPVAEPAAAFAERVARCARRRDLTVDAIALDPLTREGFDAHGGFDDLVARRLRAVDTGRFGEDPLRVLRVARLAAWLEAEPDEELLVCCRGLDLSQLAVERVFRELERLLAAPRPSHGLRVLRDAGGLALLPELAALEGVPQDPRWHPEGCVWTHTLMVVDEAARLRKGDGDEVRDGWLVWSALLHDLGKPARTSVAADGIRSYGHDELGAELAAALLVRLRAPAASVTAVEALVRHHLAPALLVGQGASDRGFRRLTRRLAQAGVDADLLERTARADHLGRTTEEALAHRFPAGDAFVERMRSLQTLEGPPEPQVRGRDVVAAGIAPGPEVGAVLARCREIEDETGWKDSERILERALRDSGYAPADTQAGPTPGVEDDDPMEVDYGPLAGLIGRWQGDQGMDISPEPDGTEENPYYETIVFEAGGDVENAESQKLAIVGYHQVVRRKSNDEVFHDQVGYWLWDAASGTVMQTLTIPRGVSVVAGGRFAGDAKGTAPVVLEVAAGLGDPDWAIAQSPFMRDNASTVAFRHKVTIDDDRLAYAETTSLEIYGRRFEHTDENVLVRS
jgi:tRNA nucleotidyltransferase (CCA-adding enzyme)